MRDSRGVANPGFPSLLRCNTAALGLYPKAREGPSFGVGMGFKGDHVFLTMLKAKLHRATVTGADMHYEGSIGIDRDLLDASGILPHEQVDVLNINTGGRFTTYAIEAPRGSADIAVNGAAARLVQEGDKVIIVAYCQIPTEEARNYHPNVVVLGEDNEIVSKN